MLKCSYLIDNDRELTMTKIEDYTYSIILEYLMNLESLINELNNRLKDLSEIELANNQLLGS